MSSVLRPVRTRKKGRTLGPVEIIRREDYADLELDAKVELIRSLVPLGLMYVEELLDEEVTALAGERYARKDALVGGRRHGSNPGTVGLAGQRVPLRVPRIRHVAGSEMPLRSYEALHGDRVVNDVLLTRVLYGISCRNYEAAAEAIPGAIGLSGSTVSRGFIQASAAQLREFQERDLSGEDVVAVVLDGKTFAEATMVIALGMTMSGAKRFLGFVETDTENAQVLTPFLRSLVERGLDVSQGVLGDPRRRQGAAIGRPEGLPGPRPGPPVPVAQARERGEVPGQARAGLMAPAPPARLQPPDVHRGAGCARDAPSRAGGPEPIRRRQSGGRAGRDPDAASPRAVRGAGPVAEDDELSRVHQCARRGTLCEGRPLAELEPTPPLAGHRAPGHRTTSAEGDGLPSPAHAPYRVEARTEDQHDDVEEESRVSNQEPSRVSTKNGLDSTKAKIRSPGKSLRRASRFFSSPPSVTNTSTFLKTILFAAVQITQNMIRTSDALMNERFIAFPLPLNSTSSQLEAEPCLTINWLSQTLL